MRLPNGERAIIADEKLVGYALNPTHPTGGPHAMLFERLLRITRANAHVLRYALVAAARDGDAKLGRPSRHGTKYELRFPMIGARGTFIVLSVWIVVDDDVPRLVTVFVE